MPFLGDDTLHHLDGDGVVHRCVEVVLLAGEPGVELDHQVYFERLGPGLFLGEDTDGADGTDAGQLDSISRDGGLLGSGWVSSTNPAPQHTIPGSTRDGQPIAASRDVSRLVAGLTLRE